MKYILDGAPRIGFLSDDAPDWAKEIYEHDLKIYEDAYEKGCI